MKPILFVISIVLAVNVFAQENNCNKFGAWVWHLEITGFDTHVELADTLANLGVKRVMVKVADGAVNPYTWPEIVDTNLVNAYKDRGLEVFAWSYNYPGDHNYTQASALELAARTGYQGFVVDVESQFNGLATASSNLFSAFRDRQNLMIAQGVISPEFKLYCTTWGNPADHDFPISIIDNYVDGFMAQTYLEAWGPSYMLNPEYWIEVGNEEYAALGASKPVHHIVSTEYNDISAETINRFMQFAGPESSIWVVPGENTDFQIWDDWHQVDWDFCETVSTDNFENQKLNVFPNPASDLIYIEGALSRNTYTIRQLATGLPIQVGEMSGAIDVTNLSSGMYLISVGSSKSKFIKL